MNDKCPKCGAPKSTPGEWPIAATFGCGSTWDGSYQSHHCALGQIAALQSRCEKLGGMLRKFQYYKGACRCCYTSRGIECLPDCELAKLLKGA